jgi:hypothetical protein
VGEGWFAILSGFLLHDFGYGMEGAEGRNSITFTRDLAGMAKSRGDVGKHFVC